MFEKQKSQGWPTVSEGGVARRGSQRGKEGLDHVQTLVEFGFYSMCDERPLEAFTQ